VLMVSREIVDERHCPIELCSTDLKRANRKRKREIKDKIENQFSNGVKRERVCSDDI
jgi:hypothetical protein